MAALAQPPAPVPTGNDIPTYYQVPETTYDCMFFSHSLSLQYDGNFTLDIPELCRH
jgi:hypothetical protein